MIPEKESNSKMIEERKKVMQKEFQKLVELHQKSRTFFYANHSNARVFRCAVPDSKVPFEVVKLWFPVLFRTFIILLFFINQLMNTLIDHLINY